VATFNLLKNVNRHKLRFWGINNPHEVIEHTSISANFNVFLLCSNKMYSGLFLAECSVTVIVHLDMLQEFLMHILEEEGPDDKLFHQNGNIPISTRNLCTSYIANFRRNVLAGDGVTLGHLYRLTLLHSTYLTPCGLTLCRNISAWTHTAPSLDICKK
jgi:hypothetical protein